MLMKLSKYLLAAFLTFHCLGITQLASAYSKDKAAFVGMLNMTEEETKKEKESKEDTDDAKLFHQKPVLQPNYTLLLSDHIYYTVSRVLLTNQFVIESPTPPPDFS